MQVTAPLEVRMAKALIVRSGPDARRIAEATTRLADATQDHAKARLARAVSWEIAALESTKGRHLDIRV